MIRIGRRRETEIVQVTCFYRLLCSEGKVIVTLITKQAGVAKLLASPYFFILVTAPRKLARPYNLFFFLATPWLDRTIFFIFLVLATPYNCDSNRTIVTPNVQFLVMPLIDTMFFPKSIFSQ